MFRIGNPQYLASTCPSEHVEELELENHLPDYQKNKEYSRVFMKRISMALSNSNKIKKHLMLKFGNIIPTPMLEF
jgi:hypothetical protein